MHELDISIRDSGGSILGFEAQCFGVRMWLPRHINGQMVAPKMSLCQEFCNGTSSYQDFINARVNLLVEKAERIIQVGSI
jgi:hypothetical protein